MNKYFIKTAFCAMLALPALTSCEFDQFPEGTIPSEEAWQTVDDAEKFNNGLLANLRSATGPSYAMIPELHCDLFNATGYNGAPPYYNSYTWIYNGDSFDGNGIWGAMYGLIYNANNVINNIDKVEVEEDNIEARKALNNYKAIAYFARAYAYTQLAEGYCKNYDKDAAANTLGLPLVLEDDVNAKPARASLEATYTLIKGDITAAKELFADPESKEVGEPTYFATRFLEARVALFSQDYETAVEAAKEVMGKYPLSIDENEYFTMWLNDEGPEVVYEPQQESPNELNGSYSAYIGGVTVDNVDKYCSSYIPTQGLLDLYEPGDMRAYCFDQTGVYVSAAAEDPNAYTFIKFPGNDALKPGTGKFEFNQMVKVFRSAEMYLVAAEAQYRIDGTGASYINSLRRARGASALTGVGGAELTGTALFNEIKNEWAREMCGEGNRFYCLKRWNEGFTRMPAQNLVEGILYTSNGGVGLRVEPTNKRWVWEIPSNDLSTNKNLIPNWRTEE